MKALAAVCLFLTLFLTAKAQTGDTLNTAGRTTGYRMKGIDISGGAALFNYTMADVLRLTAQFTNDYAGYYHFPVAHISNWHGSTGTDVLRNLYLGFVFTPNKPMKHSLFRNQEFRVGLGYTFSGETIPVNIYWDSAFTNGNTVEKKTLDYSYRSNTERVYVSYVLNTRPFMTHFACYAGVGGAIGITQWNVSSSDIQARYMQSSYTFPYSGNQTSNVSFIPLNNYTTTLISAYIPFGLKYNFSCDLNLFAETQQGFNMFSKGLAGDFKTAYTASYNIGIRYKFLDEQDKVNHKTDIFW